MAMNLDQVYVGTMVHSTAVNPMHIEFNKVIGVSKGKIVVIEDSSRSKELGITEDQITVLNKRQFLIPGFIDTHIHAPQYTYTGTGYDLPLLDWLQKYTYPSEARFKDAEFAKMAYRKVVKRTLKNGTTTASYFGTIHYQASTILCDLAEELGQRAYIGKVCMDRNSPDYYIENTKKSIEDTEEFIKYVKSKNNSLLTPVITPRFVISCTDELMLKLGKLAKKYQLPIQSHLSENAQEINDVEEMYPGIHYTGVYEKFGLLTDKTYMAHCCHLHHDEALMLSKHKTGVSHCPVSNFNLKSGIADVKFLEKNYIKVGIGTDVSGGHSPSMLNAMKSAVTASNTIAINSSSDYQPISYHEAFYLATLGGSRVLGLDDKIGNFEVGKEFDALLIDAEASDSPFDCFDEDDIESVVQKCIYLGDDRNIKKVFVAGRFVAGTDKE